MSKINQNSTPASGSTSNNTSGVVRGEMPRGSNVPPPPPPSTSSKVYNMADNNPNQRELPTRSSTPPPPQPKR